MRRRLIFAALLWLVLTAVLEFLAFQFDPFPIAAAEEARLIDGAFQMLMYLGIPVFSLVVTGLAYGLIRFRVRGEPQGDGPPIVGNRAVHWIWLLLTSALAVFVIFNPGLSGLAELSRQSEPDLVVEVVGSQWSWEVNYPQHDIHIAEAEELVLPVDQRVKFELASIDVIHSLWIPAFRMKKDLVPGMTTEMFVTPDQTGSFEEDFNMRVQCAELCGTGHARMRMRLRVVEQAEFLAWLQGQTQVADRTP